MVKDDEGGRRVKRIKLGLLGCCLTAVFMAQANDLPLIDLAAELEAHMAEQEKAKQPNPPPAGNVVKPPQASDPVVKGVPEAVAIPINQAAAPVSVEPAEWGYQQNIAPRFWHTLDPNYAPCASGQIQSPINLSRRQAVSAQGMPGLDVVYRPVPLRLIQDHQGVRGDYPLGSFVQLDNQRFEFIHYRFRTASEHHLEGFAYPMEIQFYHRDGEGRQLVMSVIVQEGEDHPFLATILENLPKEKDRLHLVDDVRFNPVRFLPEDKSFYRYLGSLTTPPCTEGVIWIVFKQPIEASVRQLMRMHQIMGTNARPIQSLNGRLPLKSWLREGMSSQGVAPPRTPGYYIDF